MERNESGRTGTRPGMGRVVAGSLLTGAVRAVDAVMVPPFLPAQTRRHLIAARREMLMAGRSLLDVYIQHLEEAERQQREEKATKIPVQ